jgi:hypothetical protein
MTKFLEENMKKYLCLFILLILMSCTSLTASEKKVTQIEAKTISSQIMQVTEELKDAASSNEYNKLKEIFLPTFKNNIIVKKMQEYDLSGLTFVFSDVNVVSKNKANSIMVVNFATASNYYKLTWKKTNDNTWKISNVAEKK